MSYDICLVDPVSKETIMLDRPHIMKGGTYAMGGTTECWLNVTYNYAPHFHRVLGDKGIRSIYGMTGQESFDILIEAANKLKEDEDPDYWAATEGNARRALLNLAELASLAPLGIWDGD